MIAEPHGGKLVLRKIPDSFKETFMEEAMSLPSITVDVDTILDMENIAKGVFSPLEGFMTKEELEEVAHNMMLPSGEVWTIPILLQLKEKPSFSKGERIAIKDTNLKIIGVMDIEDVFKIDLDSVAKAVWGTDSKEHPGVSLFYSKGEWAIGGKIWLVEEADFPLRDWELEPSETRKIFLYRGWKKIVGFQTRNAPHRAHEYLQRLALEIGDGLFINPIIGRKKKDDFDSALIIRAYELLIDKFFPKERVIMGGLATSMRYAGPREAVFHAIIRKNFGCTHFIVGRDHAGVGNFYDPFEAHRIFDKLPKDIGIEIIRVGNVFYCSVCGGMASDKTCGHGDKYRTYVSMTKVRKMLMEGTMPPLEMVRLEIAKLLVEYTHSKIKRMVE